MIDLQLLVADKNMEFALKGALARPDALGIRKITSEFIVHPTRDGGVRVSGSRLLVTRKRQASHALMLLDYEGSGASESVSELEEKLNRKLHEDWMENGRAIVIEPELDIWIWGGNNALHEILHWDARENIREWLKSRGFEFNSNEKPFRPKEAFECALRHCKQPRSSSLYEQIAGKISLRRCADDAFRKLVTILQEWFPPNR
jgi:hypothetical protein